MVTACLLLFISATVQAAPVLNSNTNHSTTGYFQLSWPGTPRQQQYELQQATSSNFTAADTLYRGPDEATVISGLGNDTYFYRVRHAGDSQWSNTVQVTVEHHSLSRAAGFFALGAVMFIALVFALLTGARGQRHP